MTRLFFYLCVFSSCRKPFSVSLCLMNTDLRHHLSLKVSSHSLPGDGHISYFPLSTAKLFLDLMLLLEAWGHRCMRGRVEAQPQVGILFVLLLGNFPLLPPTPTRENAGSQKNPCMTKMKYVPLLTAGFKSSAR